MYQHISSSQPTSEIEIVGTAGITRLRLCAATPRGQWRSLSSKQ